MASASRVQRVPFGVRGTHAHHSTLEAWGAHTHTCALYSGRASAGGGTRPVLPGCRLPRSCLILKYNSLHSQALVVVGTPRARRVFRVYKRVYFNKALFLKTLTTYKTKFSERSRSSLRRSGTSVCVCSRTFGGASGAVPRRLWTVEITNSFPYLLALYVNLSATRKFNFQFWDISVSVNEVGPSAVRSLIILCCRVDAVYWV